MQEETVAKGHVVKKATRKLSENSKKEGSCGFVEVDAIHQNALGFIAFKVQSPFPCVYFEKHAKEILLFAESSEPMHLLDLSKEYITSTIEASVSRKQDFSL